MDISRIVVLEKLIADAERRLGSYVASQPDKFEDDPYIVKQSAKILAWAKQINGLLEAEEAR